MPSRNLNKACFSFNGIDAILYSSLWVKLRLKGSTAGVKLAISHPLLAFISTQANIILPFGNSEILKT